MRSGFLESRRRWKPPRQEAGYGSIEHVPLLPRRAILGAGAIYGLAVFAVSTFIDLPAAASITGSGDTISNMARMVGYPTFAIEHIMYGMALVAFLLAVSRNDATTTATVAIKRVTVAA